MTALSHSASKAKQASNNRRSTRSALSQICATPNMSSRPASKLNDLSSLLMDTHLSSTAGKRPVPWREPLNDMVDIDLQVQFEKYKKEPENWQLPLYDMQHSSP